jgi:transcriptional regulator with XRE-family HTH domain
MQFEKKRTYTSRRREKIFRGTLKAQVIALYLRGFSEKEIAKEVGVAPKTIANILDGHRAVVAQYASSFLLEDLFAIRDRAWEWAIEVDKLREELLATSPDDPQYDDLQQRFTMVMAAYRDWWDRYMGAYYRFIGKSEGTSTVNIDARQQVLVVNAEDFYKNLQDVRRAILEKSPEAETLLALPDGEGISDWISTYGEVVTPDEKAEPATFEHTLEVLEEDG